MRKVFAALTLIMVLVSPALAAERTTLTLYHLQDVAKVNQAVEDSARRFMEDHEGVYVEVNELVNDVYKRRMAIAAATDNLPDVFITWSGATLAEYARLGKIHPLTGSMQSDKYMDRFLPAAIQQASVDGDIWAVPVENVALGVVFYNKTLFQRCSLTPPKTLEELYHVIDVCKAQGITPFALANRSAWPSSMYYMYFVDRVGGRDAFRDAIERNPDGTAKNGVGFADEKLIKAWQYAIDLIQRGAFPEDANALDEDAAEGRALFYKDEAAMYLMGTWTISYVADENPDFLDALDFFEFPTLGGPSDGMIGTVGDNFYSVSSRCERPDLAFELIQYLIDDQAVKLRLEAGRYPTLTGVPLSNPLIDKVRETVESAPYIQLWYDQWLPAKLAEVHKDICRQVFAGGMTAEEAAQTLEDAAVSYYASIQ
jgi:raffinose/stachyose/melibiose transport system substrate-binding protein